MPTIVFGLISMALGLWGISTWWWSVVELLRGLVPPLLVVLGLVALGAGVSKLRNDTPVEPADAELTEDSPHSNE
ncbi:MAG: hypothetical protein HQL57_11010 [Magnetococcales bacterium]|nr:hypothetical protein [Magnetococcales bacterium]MBF0157703.1 hypothetical protein [Magnetococcales bacterium]